MFPNFKSGKEIRTTGFYVFAALTLGNGDFEADRDHRVVVVARVIADCDLCGLQYDLHLGRFHLSVPDDYQGKTS